MKPDAGVTLQIGTFPLDVPHLGDILPHQLRVWGDQVDDILVTVDVHRSRAGRYRGDSFDEKLAILRRLLTDHQQRYPTLRIVEIDYAPPIMALVGERFFGGAAVPPKAWDGGPFYAYFFGLFAARHRYVLHLDSDMMFGGMSQNWVGEAVALLKARPDILICSPLPGPPRADRVLLRNPGIRESLSDATFRFPSMSTRIFLIDQGRLLERAVPLPFALPAMKALKARLLGNPQMALEAEAMLSEAMQQHGLQRIDFLGEGDGMWSIHPVFHSQEFYDALPTLIRRFESDDVPDAQRGDYNINDSMVDWTRARQAQTKARRMGRHFSQAAQRARDAVFGGR